MDDQQFDVAALRADMSLTRHEIDQRKAWLGFEEDDVKLLRRIDDLVDPHVALAIDALVETLLLDDDERDGTDRRRRLLREYFGGLTNADELDDAFVDRRLARLQALHEVVSSDMAWYLAAYLFYLQEVAPHLVEQSGDTAEVQTLQRVLAKVLFLDLSLAIDAYVFERDRVIRSQQRQLEELSTPVLQLRPGLLILPIIGMLDTRRAQQLTEQLLQAIRARRGRVVVLDVTGVAAVDSRVANHLIQTVDAARLMGATAIISGVSPEVAQTLVGLGISLGSVTTVADLESGIQEADRLLGLRVVAIEETPPAADQP